LSSELDDLDLNLTGPPPQRRSPGSRRVELYAFLAFVLAVACAYLIWERNETVVITEQMQEQLQVLQKQRDRWNAARDEVGEALVELSDHAAGEAELHHSQKNRKQALADLDQALYLFRLAEKMGKCGCGDTHGGQVDEKIKAVIKALQPTEEELPRLAAETESPSEEEGGEQAQPEESAPARQPAEQAEPRAEENSGGEPDG